MQAISRGLLAMLLALSSCSSPNPALYTIKPVAGVVQPGSHLVIVLREVGLARYLDRSQIVRSGEAYKLVVASNDWWGEPLAGMVTRVLIEDLIQRLPNATVTSEMSVVGTSPDATLEVEIRRLDGPGTNAVMLSGQIAVGFTKGAAAAQTVNFTVPQPTADTSGFAAAASTAVGRVADALVVMLRR
jgi:uncharacterized protein